MKYKVKLQQVLETFVEVDAESPCDALQVGKFIGFYQSDRLTWKNKGEIDAKDVEACEHSG
jgi:hypothetical protein